MDQRLIGNVHRVRQQSTPTWLFVTVFTIIALDIFILADLWTGDATCSVREGGHCPVGRKNDWLPQDQCGYFRAAVFENNRIDSSDFAEQVQKNLALYDKVAKIASQNGANMIVYPEDGIIMGARRLVVPQLQEIPDPELLTSENDNPCLEPDQYQRSHILRNLSCVARQNKLYVIANFGTRQNCQPGEQVGDRKCPEKGYFALNTDVVLDPTGRYIKRYRKYNLFLEIFDLSPSLEEVYFDTPFGRFGVFTCFDIVFERPAIDLVEKHKVDTVLFPTWWYDEAPMLTATLSQEAWSRGNQVNLLAANMFRRSLGSIGSGIYSGNNSLYTTALSENAKLMIANVASHPKNTDCPAKSFDPVTIEIDTGHPVDSYKNKNYELQKSDVIFTMQQLEAKKTICSGQVCCTFDYKINPETIGQLQQQQQQSDLLSRLVLVARDANRMGTFKFYEQVCLLATLEKPINLDSLNGTVYSREPLVGFEKLSIKGTFESRHVFPFAGHQMTLPVERKDRNFECHELSKQLTKCEHAYMIESDPSLKEKRIYSFGMYGRMYDRDIMPEGWKW